MPRASLPQNFRPSDVIRISANGKGRTGRRGVVVEREAFDATVKVFYRGIVRGGAGEHISDTVEGFTSLSNRTLHPIEGVWEGELTPGSPGRVVEYNNRAYVAPKKKGEAKVPTKPKGKTARGGRTAAAKKPASRGKTAERAPRATDAQLDKQAAQVVKLRDQQGKSWGDIEAQTGIAASRLRQLYNRGGGSPDNTRGKGAASGGRAPSKKTTGGRAKGRTGGKGKRNPS